MDEVDWLRANPHDDIYRLVMRWAGSTMPFQLYHCRSRTCPSESEESVNDSSL